MNVGKGLVWFWKEISSDPLTPLSDIHSSHHKCVYENRERGKFMYLSNMRGLYSIRVR